MKAYELAKLRTMRRIEHALKHIDCSLRRIAKALEKPSTPRQPVSVAWHVGNPREEGM